MPTYIFTFNQQENSFPDRYRVVVSGDDAQSMIEQENLTGTVPKERAMAFLDELTVRCQSSSSLIMEMIDAPDWNFIEHRFNPAKAEEHANKPKPKHQSLNEKY